MECSKTQIRLTGLILPHNRHFLLKFAGTPLPKTCPSLKFIDKVGAAAETECQTCPGGSICPENSTIAEPCWRGWYCKVENNPQPCPNGTYNDQKSADDIGWCLPCPGGYYCIANYTTKPCPLGYYCINATTEPEPCPPGTYRCVKFVNIIFSF